MLLNNNTFNCRLIQQFQKVISQSSNANFIHYIQTAYLQQDQDNFSNPLSRLEHLKYPNLTINRELLNECYLPTPTYDLSWEQKTAWALVFGIMLVLAVVGNCFVIWIVAAYRKMRTITNFFLLNLSVADLMMSSLNCIFNFVFMLNSDWPFGRIYCKVNNFVANLTVATSVFTLVAISIDRYIAIVHPLRQRPSRKKARIFIVLIWILSGLLSSPCLLFSAITTKNYINETRTVCVMLWPDGRYPTSKTEYIYNIVFLTLTYGLPMFIIFGCYAAMGRVLWGSQSIGEQTIRQRDSVKSKKKVVRMFIVIVTSFTICWLPYQSFFIYTYHHHRVASSKYIQHIYLAFYWLAMSNAMINPLIYYWMNRRFRYYFQKIALCGCFQCFSTVKAATTISDNKQPNPPGIPLHNFLNHESILTADLRHVNQT